MNTAIISPTGGSIGIGFAVPSNSAVQVVDQLKQYGETRRGWLGVHVQNVTGEIAASMGLQEPEGALVASVAPGGPADAAGIAAERRDPQIRRPAGRDHAQPAEGSRLDAHRQTRRHRGPAGRRSAPPDRMVGRLPEEAEKAEVEAEPSPDTDEPEEEPDHEELLGLSIAPLTDELRNQYRIGKTVEGVVITEVEANSPAAQKDVKPGDVIVEVTQERVKRSREVVARVAAVQEVGPEVGAAAALRRQGRAPLRRRPVA